MRAYGRYVVTGISMLCVAGAAWSQTYPVKPVRVIVPFPPGGANDIVARIVMPKLTEQLGQSFVIENRSGAGGTIGTALVHQSRADGYTLLVQTTASHTSNAHLYAKLPYDALNDFTPVASMGRLVSVLSVHPSMPTRSVQEFIALAKRRPKEILVGHAGFGSFVHLTTVLFESASRVQITQIPFKGGGPAVIGLVSGESQAMAAGIGDILEHIRAKRARPLGVTSKDRNSLLPDIPAIAETVPGFESETWVSMFAPAGTPKALVDRLHAELAKVLRDPAVAEKLNGTTYEVTQRTQDELAQRVKSDYETIGKVFREFNVKLN